MSLPNEPTNLEPIFKFESFSFTGSSLDFELELMIPFAIILGTFSDEISYNEARLNTDVELNGPEEISVYFMYKETGTGNWISTTPQTITEHGVVNDVISNLKINTNYTFIAVVSYDNNEISGPEETFYTNNIIITINGQQIINDDEIQVDALIESVEGGSEE